MMKTATPERIPSRSSPCTVTSFWIPRQENSHTPQTIRTRIPPPGRPIHSRSQSVTTRDSISMARAKATPLRSLSTFYRRRRRPMPPASDGTVTGQITGVTNPSGGPLTYTVQPQGDPTSQEQLVINPETGTYTYKPSDIKAHAAALEGTGPVTQTFTVVVTDQQGNQTPVTITLPVTPQNDTPEEAAPPVGAPQGSPTTTNGVIRGRCTSRMVMVIRSASPEMSSAIPRTAQSSSTARHSTRNRNHHRPVPRGPDRANRNRNLSRSKRSDPSAPCE